VENAKKGEMILESGIYCYKNLINNKIYIGKSKNLKRRIRQHERSFKFINEEDLESKDAILLWRSVKKYQRDNFSVEILELCEECDLDRREEYYIETLHSHYTQMGYNILKGSSGIKMSGENHPFYGKKHTPQSILLITEASNTNNGMSGRSHTEETKQLISIKMKEFHKNKEKSQVKIERKKKGKSKRIDVERLLQEGLTPKEISIALEINSSTVYRIKNKIHDK
jgi:group I intron endonuclease